MNNPNNKLINGPFNTVRLEGQVNSINKVIYVLMDIHLPVHDQLECENLFNQDISTFLADKFYELNDGNKKYDLFLEIFPSMLDNKSTSINGNSQMYKERYKYIVEVRKFFQKLFVYDDKNNKVSIHDIFKNLRLHYMDIRDYYGIFVYDKAEEVSNQAFYLACRSLDINTIKTIVELMTEIKNFLLLTIDIIENPNAPATRPTIIKNFKSADEESMRYLIKKIKDKYTNPQIKNIMNSQIDKSVENFRSLIDFIDEYITKFNDDIITIENNPRNKLIYDKINDTYNYGLSSHILKSIVYQIIQVSGILFNRTIDVFFRFTDIFFLRRFLDKNYVTNAIVYTGASHSINYVELLVKEFNFRITHASYSKISNLDDLTDRVKKAKFSDIEGFLFPETLGQCSNLETFPKNFD